jgi:hypothetical protein
MRFSGVAVALALLTGAAAAPALDCSDVVDALTCTTNDDCSCGASRGGSCAVQATECIDEDSACDHFCGGVFDTIAPVCRAGRCTRAQATACAGDCDADATVGIAELIIGVGVALERYPLAACPNLDADRDGAAGIDELVRAVGAALEGCAAALARDEQLRGIYDAELRTNHEPSGALAEVYDTDTGLALSLQLSPNESVYLSGPLTAGMVALTGDYAVTDIVYQISGEASVVTSPDEETISGTIEPPTNAFVELPDTFVLRHSNTADPARLSGTYRVQFTQSPRGNGFPSSATLRLEIAADGLAVTGGGEDLGEHGEDYGTLTAGSCLVAPHGHLQCRVLYLFTDAELSSPLGLTGVIADDGSGSGVFLSGIDPPFGPEPYVVGSWSVARTS